MHCDHQKLTEEVCRAAWKNLEELPEREAKLMYVALADQLLPKQPGEGEGRKGEVMGPVVSTMGAETLEGDSLPVPPPLSFADAMFHYCCFISIPADKFGIRCYRCVWPWQLICKHSL